MIILAIVAAANWRKLATNVTRTVNRTREQPTPPAITARKEFQATDPNEQKFIELSRLLLSIPPELAKPTDLDSMRELADKRVPEAEVMLAALAYEGVAERGIPKDEEDARRRATKALEDGLEDRANHGNAAAQTALAKLYAIGLAVSRDRARGLQLYQQAADQGYDIAELSLAFQYASGKEPVHLDLLEAAEYFKRASDHGSSLAQQMLGMYYLAGIAVPANAVKAREFFAKAAAQGVASAEELLATCYELGIGGETDIQKARDWYHKAANQGLRSSQEHLQNIPSTVAGMTNFKIAEEQYAEALDLVGEARPDIRNEIAVQLMETAASAHLPEAEGRLAMWLSDGYAGVKKNEMRSKELASSAFNSGLEKRAETGNVAAQETLGNLCFRGLGREKDESLAADWFKRAASQRYTFAEYQLARCLQYGFGTSIDLRKAIDLVTDAAAQGLPEASEGLADKYFFGKLGSRGT